MNYDSFAEELIQQVGGKNNIKEVIHCITRLRFFLNDESLADTEYIKKMPEVMGVIQHQGQYQVVVGNKVNDMYDAISKKLDSTNKSLFEDKSVNTKDITFSGKIKQGFNELIGVITGSMIPIIGLLAGSGILKGILAAFVTFGWVSDQSTLYLMFNTISDSVFHFLPIILGYTAAIKLKSNPIVIMVVAGVLIHPTIVGIAVGKDPTLSLLGFSFPVINYISSVFPILVAAYLGKYIEKILNKIIPKVISSVFNPILETIVLSFLMLFIIGPAITFVSDGLAFGIHAIFQFNGTIGGAIYCALFPILVVFGMHWPLIPIIVNDITTNGYSMMNAFSSVLMMGIAGATLAVAIKTKKDGLKQVGIAATISQICGVGEPAIYGILLKYKYVFYVVTLANIIGGAVAGTLHLVSYGFAGAVIGFASFINPKTGIDNNFYIYLITHIGTFLLSFILTWIIGYNDKMTSSDEV